MHLRQVRRGEAATGRSVVADRNPLVYGNSRSHFHNFGGAITLTSYPLSTDYISFGLVFGLDQGYSSMKYSDPETGEQKQRTGFVSTVGYHMGLELTRSLLLTGPMLKVMFAEEMPFFYETGAVKSPPYRMRHLSAELGWRLNI